MRSDRPHSLVSGPALLHTLRGLSHDERRVVKRLLGLIQRDPSVDGVNKITLMPDAPFTTYLGSDFFVFYYLDGSTIIVVDVERARRRSSSGTGLVLRTARGQRILR